MIIKSRVPAPDNSVFGRLGAAPDATVTRTTKDHGGVVKIGDRVIGHVVNQVVTEDGLEVTMDIDDEWARSVGLAGHWPFSSGREGS